MKHPLPTTIILILLFFTIQLFGLFIINQSINVQKTNGIISTKSPDTALGPAPETSPWQTLIMIIFGVGIGTVLILLLAKFKKPRLWKYWFWLAVSLSMGVTAGVLFGPKYYIIMMIICFVLGWFKVFQPNPIIHNFTELFIYPGIAVLFYHMLNVGVMIILLILISIYDIIAVRGSKHMVTLAEFQKKTVFAGLSVPLKFKDLNSKEAHNNIIIEKRMEKEDKKIKIKDVMKEERKKIKENNKKNNRIKNKINNKMKSAILGGGDVTFPLLFGGVVMENLILNGMTKTVALLQTSIIAITATISIGVLFFIAKKNKYYPAMPAVTIGCLIGWGIILLL